VKSRAVIQLIQQYAIGFEQKRHLSVAAVAVRLDCSPKWVRSHLSDFPGAWRMSGGEIRIPAVDVEKLAETRRIFSA
jgi:hypothetical protein